MASSFLEGYSEEAHKGYQGMRGDPAASAVSAPAPATL